MAHGGDASDPQSQESQTELKYLLGIHSHTGGINENLHFYRETKTSAEKTKSSWLLPQLLFEPLDFSCPRMSTGLLSRACLLKEEKESINYPATINCLLCHSS